MNAREVKKQYGGPEDRTKAYMEELYCAMCNKIQYFDTWDRGTGKIVGVEIRELWPVPITKGMGPEAEQVELMVCSACLARIDAKIVKEVEDRLRSRIWPFGGPDGNQGGQGGGVPAR